ncbi:MAG: hypothetical protein LBL69_04645 [Zoogloeaceae bacterium]|jgi:hypothetical protein|nr:hypothetical protein [Zoogloeaceae bacterium]
MFSIQIIYGKWGSYDLLEFADHQHHGQLILGNSVELFPLFTHFWSFDEYRKHWVSALERIFEGYASSALITEMHTPDSNPCLTWWPIYKVNEEVVVFHEQVLLFDGLPKKFGKAFDLSSIFDFIDPYDAKEDGGKVSEWKVEISELEKFLILMYESERNY